MLLITRLMQKKVLLNVLHLAAQKMLFQRTVPNLAAQKMLFQRTVPNLAAQNSLQQLQ
ncbi:MAG: hypothetical protein HOO08_06905 [Opitutae bacterium]|nr:hypothetical protein [Opitutae bacterium]